MLNTRLGPWVGRLYFKQFRMVMIIGESRYDNEYDDFCIIEGVLKGVGGSTFTKFMQAILGIHHSEVRYPSAVCAFWDKVIFYNYNTTFFSGGARISPSWRVRCDKRHERALLYMLRTYRPSHVIVWGKGNWDSLAVERHRWKFEGYLHGGPRPDCEFASIVVDRNRSLFTFIQHPSTGFSSERWYPILTRFLAFRSQVLGRERVGGSQTRPLKNCRLSA